jgi:predicted small integral membrane protein
VNIVQLCQILFVALIGAFALLVAYNNLRDPASNLRLVEHVLSMDSVFPDTRLKDRAITSPLAHRAAFWLIVVAEFLTAALCLIGAAILLRAHGSGAEAFHAAKSVAFAGLGLGFAVWFGGFLVIGGQWFASWQSKQWSGRESAFMFYSAIGIAFLALLHQA